MRGGEAGLTRGLAFSGQVRSVQKGLVGASERPSTFYPMKVQCQSCPIRRAVKWRKSCCLNGQPQKLTAHGECPTASWRPSGFSWQGIKTSHVLSHPPYILSSFPGLTKFRDPSHYLGGLVPSVDPPAGPCGGTVTACSSPAWSWPGRAARPLRHLLQWI